VHLEGESGARGSARERDYDIATSAGYVQHTDRSTAVAAVQRTSLVPDPAGDAGEPIDARERS
jgi:hypothetical protein